jgi:hypothetical protein
MSTSFDHQSGIRVPKVVKRHSRQSCTPGGRPDDAMPKIVGISDLALRRREHKTFWVGSAGNQLLLEDRERS